MSKIAIKDKLIVGLDVPTIKEAEALVKKLEGVAGFYKIGYQLVFCGGLELARDLQKMGQKVFLDLKLLDIDNTVAKAVENIAKLQLQMLTLHAYPKAMRAAVQAAKGTDLCLLGVTVLTSMDKQDLCEAGYDLSPEALVLKRAIQAKEAGMGGVVASAQEAASLRRIIGDKMALVTPGIRLTQPPSISQKRDDQKRIMSPAEAIKSGASHLVVARPIIEAPDPKEACCAILTEIEQAQ